MEHKKTFEYGNVIVNVHYDHIPQKEDLKEACSRFMLDVLKQQKKSHCCNNDSKND